MTDVTWEDEPDIPLSGRTLIVGGLKVGKTRLTARVLRQWLETHGSAGVVVLDFAPEVSTEAGRIGGRLQRFLTVPPAIWYGAIDARAPRSEADTPSQARELARENAKRAREMLSNAPPSPQAVFINDVTIALQSDPANLEQIQTYCAPATCVVINAYDGAELGDRSSPLTRNERTALEGLRSWVDRTIELA